MKKSDPEQLKRFIETARELDCDEDEAAFDEKLKRIAAAKPQSKTGSMSAPKTRKPRRSRSV